jgi:hypothetical protein
MEIGVILVWDRGVTHNIWRSFAYEFKKRVAEREDGEEKLWNGWCAVFGVCVSKYFSMLPCEDGTPHIFCY